MARYAYVNGRYVDHRDASVHIEDRGYQLADGVYEVVGVRDGRPVASATRLSRSLASSRMSSRRSLSGGTLSATTFSRW